MAAKHTVEVYLEEVDSLMRAIEAATAAAVAPSSRHDLMLALCTLRVIRKRAGQDMEPSPARPAQPLDEQSAMALSLAHIEGHAAEMAGTLRALHILWQRQLLEAKNAVSRLGPQGSYLGLHRGSGG